ncbi:unnamed protein product [Oncorhynchus mykiss]|uniref:Uncharacterized protein n=1 Tax=Oncorhynchus mykiss TaxID=8022 RepID=A0A060WGI7_ONCMY|nr:unnamed protein product [Oncorhynchus mykiss]
MAENVRSPFDYREPPTLDSDGDGSKPPPPPPRGLCVVAEYWRELQHTVLHVNPEHTIHAQWVTCLLKPGFICEEHTSSVCQWPSKVSICPLKSVTTLYCSQIKILVRTTSTQKSFPETVSDSLCRNPSVAQTHSFISCPGGWPQTIPLVKKPEKDVLGWCGWRYCQSSLLRLMVEKLTFKFSGNSVG